MGVEIQGSMLEGRVKKVVLELHERNIPFIPHFWLSDEWFCPDGIPGIAIPFYLAHPRLEKLERAQLLEVEGGDEAWCLTGPGRINKPCASDLKKNHSQ